LKASLNDTLLRRVRRTADEYHRGVLSYEEFTARQRKNWDHIESLHRSEQVLAALRGDVQAEVRS
jgi:hypothetical protein